MELLAYNFFFLELSKSWIISRVMDTFLPLLPIKKFLNRVNVSYSNPHGVFNVTLVKNLPNPMEIRTAVFYWSPTFFFDEQILGVSRVDSQNKLWNYLFRSNQVLSRFFGDRTTSLYFQTCTKWTPTGVQLVAFFLGKLPYFFDSFDWVPFLIRTGLLRDWLVALFF